MKTLIVVAVALTLLGCSEDVPIEVSVQGPSTASHYIDYSNCKVYAEGKLLDLLSSGETKTMVCFEGDDLEATFVKTHRTGAKKCTDEETATDGLVWRISEY